MVGATENASAVASADTASKSARAISLDGDLLSSLRVRRLGGAGASPHEVEAERRSLDTWLQKSIAIVCIAVKRWPSFSRSALSALRATSSQIHLPITCGETKETIRLCLPSTPTVEDLREGLGHPVLRCGG